MIEKFGWKYFSLLTTSVLIFLFIITALLKPFRIEGKSMEPYFRQGDIVLVNRLFFKIQKDDVIVVKLQDKSYAVKRVIAEENDKIEYKDGNIFVNGKNRGKIASGDYRMFFENSSFVVDKDSFFLLGDNRLLSIDSRFWGSIHRKMIKGKVVINLFSFFRKEGVQ